MGWLRSWRLKRASGATGQKAQRCRGRRHKGRRHIGTKAEGAEGIEAEGAWGRGIYTPVAARGDRYGGGFGSCGAFFADEIEKKLPAGEIFRWAHRQPAGDSGEEEGYARRGTVAQFIGHWRRAGRLWWAITLGIVRGSIVMREGGGHTHPPRAGETQRPIEESFPRSEVRFLRVRVFPTHPERMDLPTQGDQRADYRPMVRGSG